MTREEERGRAGGGEGGTPAVARCAAARGGAGGGRRARRTGGERSLVAARAGGRGGRLRALRRRARRPRVAGQEGEPLLPELLEPSLALGAVLIREVEHPLRAPRAAAARRAAAGQLDEDCGALVARLRVVGDAAHLLQRDGAPLVERVALLVQHVPEICSRGARGGCRRCAGAPCKGGCRERCRKVPKGAVREVVRRTASRARTGGRRRRRRRRRRACGPACPARRAARATRRPPRRRACRSGPWCRSPSPS